MPELPEVEVTKLGIIDSLKDYTIESVYFGKKSLREPLSPDLLKLKGAKVIDVIRRAKYIIITTTQGSLIIHLGMTGHLKVLAKDTKLVLHDHFELVMSNGKSIRLNDSRRFGLVLYVDKDTDPYSNKYLKDLAMEPFDKAFNAAYLYNKLQHKSVAIKQAIMDNHIVVGVGNIYASEVLFLSKVDPHRPCNKISLAECKCIVKNIVKVLKQSIQSGGTTIRDFSGADGKMGYFVQKLNVYGHEGQECPICKTKILSATIGQRNTYYCPNCQK